MRDWLALWPRRLQLFAVALSLLAAVAPSWHVCSLGGQTAEHQEHGAGHQFIVARNADGSPGPLICADAPRAENDENLKGARLAPAPQAHEHVNCLAMLLQDMPAQVAAPPVLWDFAAPRAIYAGEVVELAAFEAPLTKRGRAPPLDR